MIQIYSPSGSPLADVMVGEGSRATFQLMREDSVTLHFALAAPVDFPLGSYADFPAATGTAPDLWPPAPVAGRRYCVREVQKPQYDGASGSYAYELRLDADYWLWNNYLLRYDPASGATEVSFSLTASLAVQASVAMSCIEALGFRHTDGEPYRLSIDAGVGEAARAMTWDGAYLLDALFAMAEAWEVDCWVADGVVHFGRMPGGEPVTLRLGSELSDLSHNRSSDVYATRIYAFGSTRNLLPTYRRRLVMTATRAAAGRVADDVRPLQLPYFPEADRLLAPSRELGAGRLEGAQLTSGEAAVSVLYDGVDVAAGAWRLDPSPGAYLVAAEVRAPMPAAGGSVEVARMERVAISLVWVAAGGAEKVIHTEAEDLRAEWEATESVTVRLPSGLRFSLGAEETGTGRLEVRVVATYDTAQAAGAKATLTGQDVRWRLTRGAQQARARVRFLDGAAAASGELVATWNPDYATGAVADIALPEGTPAPSVGDRYEVLNLIEGRVPVGYFMDDDEATVPAVAERRLMLPEGTPFVEAEPGLPGRGVVEAVVVFDDVYPRRVGTLSEVTTRTAAVEAEGGEREEVAYWRFRDAGLTFSADYLIEGEKLRVTFQTGRLAGMTFGVIFNPDGASPAEQLWEIVRSEDYGRPLPDAMLAPGVGDEYVLSGFDISMVSEQYVRAAEEELLERAQAYARQAAGADGTYTAHLMSHWVAADVGARLLGAGSAVRLEAEGYFRGVRETRVIGWDMALDLPYDAPEYTFGEAAAYSRLTALEKQVETLIVRGAAYAGQAVGGGATVYVITQHDTTEPTDANVFSALRSRREFLSKREADTATAPLRMAAGLTVEGGLAADSAELDEAEAGKLRATEATVDALAATRADMAEASVGGGLSVGGAATFGGAAGSRDFAAGLAGGRGWRVGPDGAAELDALTVRRFLEVPELRFNRVDVRLGDKWRAPGGGLIESVDTAARTCRLKLEEGELGAVRAGDICMGIYHSTVASENAAEDTDDSRMNRQIAGFATVYFTVTEVTGERGEAFSYQLRPRSERWPREAEPRAMMTFVVYGSFTDTDRQTSVYETRTYTRMLRGQNTWETGPENIAMQTGDLSNLAVHGIRGMEGYSAYLNSVYFTGVIRQVDAEGEPVLTARDRGEWQAAEAPYDYYDRVSHGGRLWLCIAEEGTTDEPSEASAAWLLQVDSGGEGAAAVWVEVTSSAGVMFQGGVGRTELRATVRRAPSEDVTALVPSSRFSWERTGPDAEADALWNAAHRAVGPVIEVSGDDVARQATFQCLVALDGLAI